MKTHIISAFILALATVLTGCTTKNDIDETMPSKIVMTQPKAIDFNAPKVLDIPDTNASRGTIVTVNNITSIGAYAYYTGDGTSNNWATNGENTAPNIINNSSISNNAGTWTLTDNAYWPAASDANVSFFAYSPYGTASNGITVAATKGAPVMTYIVPETVADQPDILIATPQRDCPTTYGSVTFHMRHALTGVAFKAKGSGTITTVTLSGVSTSGSISLNDAENMTWTNLNDPQTTTTFSIPLNGGSSITLDSSSFTNLQADNGYLMMIPQTLTDSATLTVTFSDAPTKTVKLTSSSTTTWTAGQRIVYTLSI